jgi:c-di-GMP-binding flagellar brake protein YcgR
VSVREDRRGSQRARATWPVQIEMPTGEFIRGRVADISASGVRVTVPAAIPTGTELRLMMTLPGPPDRIEVVAVDGLVVRSDDDGVAVDIMSVGGPLPDRAARRVRPHLDRWEARRRSPRVHLPVVVTLRHGGGALVPAETVDLSAFGARVTTGLALRAGERIDVLLPDGETEALALPAVVWDVDERGAALVFANVSPAQFERMSRFVAALLEGPA